MMPQLAHYLAALFDPTEQTCAASALTDGRAYTLVETLERTPNWVSVNPIRIWRSHKNVTAFRNFVLEFDSGSTSAEQVALVDALGFPYTTAVTSGNKSVHFVCALSKPVSREDFVEIRRQLDIIVPGSDKSVKDPARLTRAPGAVHATTGRMQEALYLGERVDPEKFADWIASHADKVAEHDAAKDRFKQVEAQRLERGELSASSLAFLNGEAGVKGSSRHARLYAITCELCDTVGLSYEDALALTQKCADLQGISSEPGRQDEAERITYDVYFRRISKHGK